MGDSSANGRVVAGKFFGQAVTGQAHLAVVGMILFITVVSHLQLC